MVSYERGDLLSSNARCLVNAVNCEGFMGKGLAYQFKRRFPKNNEDYVRACHSRVLKVGVLHSFEEGGKLIVNFPTKDKWREKSKIEYIEKGLASLRDLLASGQVPSVAIPPLGCGNGGLQWNDVKPLILHYLSDLSSEVQIQIYPPSERKKTLPKPTLEHLILIKVAERLEQKKMSQLQTSALFFDFYSGQKYFPMELGKRGLVSPKVTFGAKEIKRIKEAGNFSQGDFFSFCQRQIISKTILKKMEQYDLCINKSVALVNLAGKMGISQEIGIVMYCLQQRPMDDHALISMICKEYMMKNVSRKDVKAAVNFLQEQGVALKDLLGQYELAIS